MLDKEFKYYLDNHDSLVRQYEGKFVVIKEESVIGVYETEQDAYEKTLEQKHELGTFLIQQCLPGEKNHTQTFHSRVVFGQ